jgi:putative ABC transport system permease protein
VVTAQFSQTTADFFVLGTQGTIPQGALDMIAEVEGVEVVTALGISTVTVDGVQYSLAAVDPATANLAFDYNSDPELTELGGGVFIDPVLVAAGVDVGDTVTLKGAEGSQALEVTGRYLNEGDANLWVDFPTAEALVGEVPIAQAMVVAAEGEDVDELQTEIQDALRTEYPLVVLQQPGQLEQFANQFIDLLLGVISALLASALVIAILGVANTLLLSVTERTREIGLLRAVGLKKRSVWRMITVESMVMAIFGTILGMVLGVSLGAALVIALEDFGFDGPTIPWAWLAVYTVLAAIAGVVAAIWPAWRASRLDILQAIAADG